MMQEEDDIRRQPRSENATSTPDGASSVHSVEIHDSASSPASQVEVTTPTAASPERIARDLAAPDVNAEAEDASGLATVQSGLWGLWNTVSNAGVVKAAVSTAKQVTDRAVQHVQERGLVQSAIDSAQAAVESAKRVDTQILHGTISKLVDTTLQAAHKGMDKVREHIPGDDTQQAAGAAGGPNFVVTSTAFEKVNALRVALQGKYGDVALRAMSTESGVAPQPVGFAAGFKGAEGRIAALRQQGGLRQGEVIASIENFIVEAIPGLWMDMAAVVLRDDERDITVRTVSQGVTVDAAMVDKARVATAADFPQRDTGFATTVGKLIHESNPTISDSDWHGSVCGLSRQSQLHVAIVVALGEYAIRLRAAASQL